MQWAIGLLRRRFPRQSRRRAFRRSRDLRRSNRRRYSGSRWNATIQEEMISKNQPRPAGRAPGFIYRKVTHGILRRGSHLILHCENVSLLKLAERYGTPLYVYSAAMIHERYAAFDHAFRETPHLICYSVKANSNI